MTKYIDGYGVYREAAEGQRAGRQAGPYPNGRSARVAGIAARYI